MMNPGTIERTSTTRHARVGVVLCLLTIGGSARAGEDPPADEAPGRPALSIRYSFWKGPQVYRGDELVDVGLFGGNAAEVFAGSSAAIETMMTGYRWCRITGETLKLLGYSALVTQVTLLVTNRQLLFSRAESTPQPLFLTLLIGGLTARFLGGLLADNAASVRLSDAVQLYNSGAP